MQILYFSDLKKICVTMETWIDQSALRAYISTDIDWNFMELQRKMSLDAYEYCSSNPIGKHGVWATFVLASQHSISKLLLLLLFFLTLLLSDTFLEGGWTQVNETSQECHPAWYGVQCHETNFKMATVAMETVKVWKTSTSFFSLPAQQIFMKLGGITPCIKCNWLMQ